ncbi:hypothetical protein [Chitinophaga sp. Cy-1792]|uniref:hypothetical protein n=1 Tax=Chitinophaga sp. Cy-1792 TaxID=2608339 RepID=UPI0014234F1E|nr:hypothetical protein [Chitinophaga sp. Cy-1792]NIG52937.1 hypothetical protein [Chitinophaga sp. Cy-1792]
MYQRFSCHSRRLSVIAALLLIFVSCRRDNNTLQPIPKAKTLALSNSTPDTIWKLSELTFTYGGTPGAPGVINSYDSSGKLTAMDLNGNFGNPYGTHNFQVYYNANYVYFYDELTEDTTLTVRLDSIGRPSDYTCLHTSTPWGNSLQTGHITYNETNHTLSEINRTIDGVPNIMLFWQHSDYDLFLRTNNGLTVHYLTPEVTSAAADTTETLHAYYDEVNQPDEWPVRIMQYSGILPYNPKHRIIGINYDQAGGSSAAYTYTNHVIDYGKKLTSYTCNGNIYSLKWVAFPQ